MMKTIIHVGQHKTGTTSIQHYLQKHRENLISAGLYVPDSLLGFANPSHFLLNVFALDSDRDSTAKIQLRETVSESFMAQIPDRLQQDVAHHYREARRLGCRDILWTNEGLYLLNSLEEYQRLLGLFAPFSETTQCICVFRDKESYRASYMRQLDSLGLPLSTDPGSYRYLEPDSWLLDYKKKKALLETVFDKTSFPDYNREDMIKPFMDILGYEMDAGTETMRLNTSL